MKIEATDRTPAISLTHDPLRLSISGESFPEDVSAFYGEVISAINQLATHSRGKIVVEMAMVYINSSSIKAMYRIFEGLDAYRQAGNEVQVTWKAQADDDIMQELGEDFKDRFQALNFIVEQHG
jgi:SiaC family regulatory phosphoprotein